MNEKNISDVGQKKRTHSGSIILRLLIFVAVTVLFANFFSAYLRIEKKQKKYDELKAKYEAELVKKSEYDYLLDKDNQLEYIERIAREKYGYIAPGERAFYDSSAGK